jgi:hypothetical protein
MVGIYDPKNRLVPRTVCASRKQARRAFARVNNAKWNELWMLGFRVRAVNQRLDG